MQATANLAQAACGTNMWNFVIEGDAMPGIMGATSKGNDQRWKHFKSQLQEEWSQPEPDTRVLSEEYGQGDAVL